MVLILTLHVNEHGRNATKQPQRNPPANNAIDSLVAYSWSLFVRVRVRVNPQLYCALSLDRLTLLLNHRRGSLRRIADKLLDLQEHKTR